MALSKIDTTNMIEDVPQSKLDNNINFRNIIINGGMDLAQRGTSSTGLTTGGYRTVDRFNFGIATAGTWTITQDSTVPTGQGFAKSTKLDCTTANASLSAGSELTFFQKIEGQNLQYLKKGTSNAESVTLSFWVRSNKTGTYTAEIFDNDNSRQISKTYTISSADTWEKKTITFAGDTTGALDNDNAVSFWIFFWLGAGSNYTSGTLNTSWNSSTTANRVSSSQVNLADSTSNEFYITGVQLEAGEVASDFEFLPYDVNYQRCARYYEVTQAFAGVNSTAGTQCGGLLNWNVKKRATPSLSPIGTLKVTDGYTADYTQSSASISNVGILENTSFVFIPNLSGLTAGRPYFMRVNHNGVAVSSEL